MNKSQHSNFGKSDPKKRASLNAIMAGVPEDIRTKVFQVLYEHDIEPDDPMFLIFAAMTEAKLSVAPIPEQLEELQKGIKAVLLALCEQVETSLKRHEELNYNFYVTAERLSAILNQKLFEIERSQKHQQGAFSVSVKTAWLWCLVTSAIGGLVGALLILTVATIAAAQ
ncbi:hypothetical protein IQ249_15260 [Lusitaniella coriacea LEGE 07157]|uniref:Uncharacterized protein n=1 Tax=Lusitaniella coriacea LEGE 07157 TaxID=945747 RepID=A0A8J7DZD2_9CYAN|nr:DUF6753 family protein [Lusitaniella coriacea]MBE9117258.1 hypothetical protein [Lusitaniella coriacea LEGE 07157]